MKAAFKNRLPLWFGAGVLLQASALVQLTGGVLSGAELTNYTEEALRAAIETGGTVTFAKDGVIMLSNTITVSRDSTLDGSGRRVAISGSGAVRVFQVTTNVALSLMSLTISDGYSSNGGAIFNAGGKLILVGSLLQSNTVSLMATEPGITVEGGAVCNLGGTVSVTNCAFFRNLARQPLNTASNNFGAAAEAQGGALWNQGGTMNLQSCTFTSNSACGVSGNGLWPHAGSDGTGGAVYNNGIMSVNDCTFQWNTAFGGAAGAVVSASLIGFTGGAGYGGAIANLGDVSVSMSGFFTNSVVGGLGGWGYSGPGSPGGNGQAGGKGSGGGVFNSGMARMWNSAFIGNTAVGGAGGLGGAGANPSCPEPYCWPMRGGDGGEGGGALGAGLFSSGPARVWNTTLAGNIAVGGNGGEGGLTPGPNGWSPPPITGGSGGKGGSAFGAICDAGGLTCFTNCTLALNSASNGLGGAGGTCPVIRGVPGSDGIAGGALLATGTILINTLLGTNFPPGSNCVGTITDAGHNLSSDGTPAFSSTASHNDIDAKLGPIAFNGGATPTVPLMAGSRAIDTGDTIAAPTSDQRDHPRPVGSAADIGAYEYGSVPTLRIGAMQAGSVDLLLFSDVTGAFGQLLASTNLFNWAPIATNQIGSEGMVSFTDACEGASQKFYRANQISGNMK